MKGYMKLTAALAAFALLLVVMGLSTQGSVSAQNAPGTITVTPKYVCSLAACDNADATIGTNDFIIEVAENAAATVEIRNLDVATESGVNPKVNQATGTGSVYKVVQQGTGTDNALEADEIRAFNGNRIRITYTPDSGFATTAELIVDNVKPTLVTTSPNIPLVVKGGVNIAFSADLTDGGSGYTTTVGTSGSSDIDDLNATPGLLVAATNGITPVGGVRLVVAGNVVALGKSNFTAIDGGWTVSAEIGSSAIQNIGANVPWYFETRDRAGNTRRTSGSIALKGAVTTGGTGTGGITDTRFISGLPAGTFSGTMMKVTRGSESETVAIDSFTNTSGLFTITIPTDGFFAAADATSTDVMAGDKFELVGSNLLTIDSKPPRLASPSAVTGIVYSTSAKGPVRGLMARANSIQVNFADDGKFGTERAEADGGPDGAGSGLNAASVTPAAFTVSGNTVSSTSVQGNSVYLTLGENLEPDEQPSITIASGAIMDKAGNAFGGDRISKAEDGLGPNLSLSESGDLHKEKVTVTITTDEQLASLPTVRLGRVQNSDGDILNDNALQCEYAAVAEGGDPATEPALNALTVPAAGDNNPPDSCLVADTGVNARYVDSGLTATAADGRPGAPNPSQTAALSYTYGVTATTANPTDTTGGKYNVYVEGVDTQNPLNKGNVGHASDANNSAAFTFQLDTVLNGGEAPIVSVSDNENVAVDEDPVEAVDPMIVTVAYLHEGGSRADDIPAEYPGDSYRTVELTSAELTVKFADGSSEKKTFNLTTEVSTADNIKYTIPILNPKVGEYSLTVKAVDSAGNDSGTAGHTAKWEVIAARPVDIELQPGWNLISLPFQPGNPAINSVIPGTHPVDIVMTFDNASQTWLVSRRDAETGSFVGDIPVLTANTAYFVRTDKFQAIKLLRPPLATAAAAPPPPPAITVVEGWNLVPVVSNEIPTPDTISADDYFGTLGANGWLKALTFNTLVRTWDSVTPGQDPAHEVIVGKGYWLYATKAGVIIP